MKFVRTCVRVDACWKLQEVFLIVKFLFETGWKLLLLLLHFFLSESCTHIILLINASLDDQLSMN